MHYKSKEIICVATDTELKSEPYYRRLWLVSRCLSEIVPRRSWLDEIADCLRDFRGEITYISGDRFQIPFVDDVFDHDEHMRWMGEFLKADVSSTLPLMQCRKLERLRLIDLYIRISHPLLAQHFWR